jgi:hypothetical protein
MHNWLLAHSNEGELFADGTVSQRALNRRLTKFCARPDSEKTMFPEVILQQLRVVSRLEQLDANFGSLDLFRT